MKVRHSTSGYNTVPNKRTVTNAVALSSPGAQCWDPVWDPARDPARLTNQPQTCHPHLPWRGPGQWVDLSLLNSLSQFESHDLFLTRPPSPISVWQVRAASPLCLSSRKCRRSWRILPWFILMRQDKRRGLLPTLQGTTFTAFSLSCSSLDFFFKVNSSEIETIFCGGLKPNLYQKYFFSHISPSLCSNTLLSEV